MSPDSMGIREAAAPAQALPDDTNHLRECDIVMKGGITSGIVYPLAISELAKRFRFRQVGGTSAGAIAAVVTAAAEYSRQHKTGRGFQSLHALPDELGTNGRLLSLFQPTPQSEPLFSLLLASLGSSSGRIGRLADAAIRGYPGFALAGVLLPVLVLLPAVMAAHGYARALAIAAVLVGATLLAVLFMLAGVLRDAWTVIPRQLYGLCTGMSSESASVPALTPWLSALIDETAGVTHRGTPLTFGDLWGANEESPEVDLQVMTTCVSLGRPFRLPFDTREFYFSEHDMRRLFPEYVVAWMKKSVEGFDNDRSSDGLHPFPMPRDVPLVVAARMSLSFPMLISAVPLWRADYRRSKATGGAPLERVWFCDGGICSNFPVHLFDRALPVRPTIGIGLRPVEVDGRGLSEQEEENVILASSFSDQIQPWFIRMSTEPDLDTRDVGPGSPLGFLGLISTTMQNWMDRSTVPVPGYRDRIADIYLDETVEGGMNLNMNHDVVARLSRRGSIVGERLCARYTDREVTPLNWRGHRWARFLSTMAGTEEWLLDFLEAYELDRTRNTDSISSMLQGERAAIPAYRPDSQRWLTECEAATNELVALARAWQSRGRFFGESAPKPAPELRLRAQR